MLSSYLVGTWTPPIRALIVIIGLFPDEVDVYFVEASGNWPRGVTLNSRIHGFPFWMFVLPNHVQINSFSFVHECNSFPIPFKNQDSSDCGFLSDDLHSLSVRFETYYIRMDFFPVSIPFARTRNPPADAIEDSNIPAIQESILISAGDNIFCTSGG